MSETSNQPVPENTPEERDPAAMDRRKFVRDVGSALFAITIVDLADVGFLSTAAAQSGGGCGNQVVDAGCSQTTADENCGFKLKNVSGTPYDPDESCSSSNNDQSCAQTTGNVDETCSTSNEDQNCNKPHSTPGQTDSDESCKSNSTDESCGNGGMANVDQSCNTTSEDENCQTAGGANGAADDDQSCTNTAQGADESCSGTNANYNQDAHCGQPVMGASDPDEGCGYSTLTSTDQDNYCVPGAMTFPESDATGN